MQKDNTRKKEENRKRSSILKNWFSSFFMTVGVVIVVIAFVPRSPVVSIDKIREFAKEVLYQVSVIDDDLAIIDGTLKITLENQFEHYEQPLQRGVSTGVFNSLNEATVYTLKVLADKGFGLEVLSKLSIQTTDSLGAGVITNELVSAPTDQFLAYEVTVFTSDPYDEIQNFYLDVYYSYLSYYEAEEYFLGRFSLQEGVSFLNVSGLYLSNYIVRYEIIGVSVAGETVYDEFSFHTPLQIWASVYLGQVTSSVAKLGVYVDMILGIEITYRLDLFRNSRLIDSLIVPVPNMEEEPIHQEEDNHYYFKNLTRNTDYVVEFVATYIDPITLVEAETIVSSLEFTTTWFSDFTISITEQDAYFEAIIQGTDEHWSYQLAVVTILQGYEFEGEVNYYYYDSYSVELGSLDGSYLHSATLLIDKPIFGYYQIIISVNDDTSSEIYLDLATISHLLDHDEIIIP